MCCGPAPREGRLAPAAPRQPPRHAHGVSVVAIARWKNQWRVVRGKNSRRIHGYTPWGTYLTCEENFNGYFGASNREQTWTRTPEQARYGFSATGFGFGYGWHLYERRFDLSDPDYRNEENRFGWIVEIDPFDATQKPVKRTALGRFKHAGIALAEGRGCR